MLPRMLLLVVVLFLCVSLPARAQQDSIRPWRMGLVCGTTASIFIYGHIMTNQAWWKGAPSRFHTEWKYDWKYALGADKLGHAYFPYVVTKLYAKAFQWSGVQEERSLWYGSGLAFTYQTYIEIRDGFSQKYGFSWGDFGANVIGAAIPLVQYYHPSLQDYHFKMSFYPSERFRNGSHSFIIDDYESAYHWITFPMQKIIPSIPSNLRFIHLALGHGVKQLDDAGGGTHELFLSLDFNTADIRTGIDIVDGLFTAMSHYHLPAPAVRIYPNVVFYGLKF